jgi:DNA (cytosine-5)-methyltransferase 1
MKLRVLDLFSGAGMFSLGLERTGGFETVAFCEIDPYARAVLRKHWPKVLIYEDVQNLTGDVMARDGITVDCITGGFPCQDLSIAGRKAGMGEGTRSGLFWEIDRLVGELRPQVVLLENVANLLSGPDDEPGGWFGALLGALAERGYDAEWQNIPASTVGAPHRRERVWIIAYPQRAGRKRPIADASLFSRPITPFSVPFDGSIDGWCRLAERGAPVRNSDGLPVSVERNRIKLAGNSLVPQIPEMIGRAILAAEHPR